jgi:hypothetical protein
MQRIFLSGAAVGTLVLAQSAGAHTHAAHPRTALVSVSFSAKDKTMKRPGTLRIVGSLDMVTQRGSGLIDMSDLIKAQGAPAKVATLFRGPFVAVSESDVYMALAAFALFPGTKPWLHAHDLTGASGGGGTDFATNYTSPQTPFGELDAFRRAGAKPKSVGTATLHGIATTRYHLTVDIERAVATFAPAKKRARAIASARQLVRLSHNHTETCDIWVDAAGTAWRESCTEIESVNDKPLEFGPTTSTSDILKFGVPVKVHVPPASQVMTEAEWEKATSAPTGGTTTTK